MSSVPHRGGASRLADPGWTPGIRDLEGLLDVASRAEDEDEALAAEPALVNSDAAGKAWFFKVRIADRNELGGLMDEAAYQKHVA